MGHQAASWPSPSPLRPRPALHLQLGEQNRLRGTETRAAVPALVLRDRVCSEKSPGPVFSPVVGRRPLLCGCRGVALGAVRGSASEAANCRTDAGVAFPTSSVWLWRFPAQVRLLLPAQEPPSPPRFASLASQMLEIPSLRISLWPVSDPGRREHVVSTSVMNFWVNRPHTYQGRAGKEKEAERKGSVGSGEAPSPSASSPATLGKGPSEAWHLCPIKQSRGTTREVELRHTKQPCFPWSRPPPPPRW